MSSSAAEVAFDESGTARRPHCTYSSKQGLSASVLMSRESGCSGLKTPPYRRLVYIVCWRGHPPPRERITHEHCFMVHLADTVNGGLFAERSRCKRPQGRPPGLLATGRLARSSGVHRVPGTYPEHAQYLLPEQLRVCRCAVAPVRIGSAVLIRAEQ